MSNRILPPQLYIDHESGRTKIVETAVVWKTKGVPGTPGQENRAWTEFAQVGPITLALHGPGSFGPSGNQIVSGYEYVILVQAPPRIPGEYWVVTTSWAESREAAKLRAVCDTLDHWKAVRTMYDGRRWTANQVQQARIIFEKARLRILKPIIAGMPQLEGA